jgi:hypothetical protein
MGWDVVYVFSNKRILESGAGAGKGFFGKLNLFNN